MTAKHRIERVARLHRTVYQPISSHQCRKQSARHHHDAAQHCPAGEACGTGDSRPVDRTGEVSRGVCAPLHCTPTDGREAREAIGVPRLSVGAQGSRDLGSTSHKHGGTLSQWASNGRGRGTVPDTHREETRLAVGGEE
eukprot:EG_transcript_13234